MDFNDYHVSELKGVGPAIAQKLENMGISTLQDVLFHLPFRYEDRTKVISIGAIAPGVPVQISGEILHSEISFGKKRSLICRIHDGTGAIDLRFFHFSMSQKKSFVTGKRLLCFGDVTGGWGKFAMIHPEIKWIEDGKPLPLTDRLTPVYPTTEGVKQHTFRKITEQTLNLIDKGLLDELLPKSVLDHFKWQGLAEALQFVHRPPKGIDLNSMLLGEHPSKQRLALEELLAFNISMLRLRQNTKKEPAVKMMSILSLQKKLLNQLPFELTGAQKRVIEEISLDLNKSEPMMRLVQGDVGSGKTLVAAMAALQAIEAGYQVALMAPTEILAEQHWNNFSEWFGQLNVQTGFLVSKLKVSEKRQMLADIENGEAQMIIGTHALFQAGVHFHNLALVIIDEQHRFGVNQRLALKDKAASTGFAPHQLIMTATPIPRTLSMTAYADLDTSIIDELPPGRTPITTSVLSDDNREKVIQSVARVCQTEKRQAYWVCTLIEESEELQCQAAEDTAQQLAEVLPYLNVGLVHGKMKPFDKQSIMDAFKTGEIDLLVATTVIEVGVDVPNATLMVIENPERLGLAQLHQLRGRVGRGSAASYCIMLYQSPLSKQGRERLQVMRETNDGFLIAEKDLEIRGPGEVLGIRQTGLVQFKVADLIRDRELIPRVSTLARSLLTKDPQTADKLVKRWLNHREIYGQV